MALRFEFGARRHFNCVLIYGFGKVLTTIESWDERGWGVGGFEGGCDGFVDAFHGHASSVGLEGRLHWSSIADKQH